MEAQIIQLHIEQPEKLSCLQCQNVFLGTKGLYCGAYNEIITFDDVANECNEYEPFE